MFYAYTPFWLRLTRFYYGKILPYCVADTLAIICIAIFIAVPTDFGLSISALVTLVPFFSISYMLTIQQLDTLVSVSESNYLMFFNIHHWHLNDVDSLTISYSKFGILAFRSVAHRHSYIIVDTLKQHIVVLCTVLPAILWKTVGSLSQRIRLV